MDPEQTFLRVHARLSGMLSQLLTPRIRLALEYLYLAGAVALFCLLVVMHTNFVQQPGCSSEFSGIEFGEAQLVQIKIISGGLWASKGASYIMDLSNLGRSAEKILEVNGDKFNILASKFWSTWVGPGARRSKIMFRTWKGDKEFEPQSENAADATVTTTMPGVSDLRATGEGSVHHPLSAKESFKAAIMYFFRKWYFRVVSFWRNIKQLSDNTLQLMVRSNWSDFLNIIKDLQLPSMEHLLSTIVRWFERRSKAFEPTYLYGVEKGYFLLSEGAKIRHSVRTINITISARNPCFGNRWQQLLINSIVGYDTILTNSLVNSPGHGYLYNFQTKELYDLSYGHEPPAGPTRFGDYFVTKCGVLLMSLFVFFTTTMSVSFTLRETQSRMLRFTVQLQHHARHQLPTFQLIFVHVIESLVFVPIMIGILFFLFEFYDDQLLAFLVLTLVWLCELFTMISVRTSISMQFFPRFFLLYFLVFHIYFFSYTYGFSYLAFSAMAAFMQHLILYFWNRFEAEEELERARVAISDSDVAAFLPSNGNGKFLKMFLGPVNVRVARKEDKIKVKDEYNNYRDRAAYMFLLFPSTLLLLRWWIWDGCLPALAVQVYQAWLLFLYTSFALRENVLIVNGSDIRPWWIYHHYLAMLMALVSLTWEIKGQADCSSKQRGVQLFLRWAIMQGIAMHLQNRYQRQRLRTRIALGKAKRMDVVAGETAGVEGQLLLLYPVLFILQGFEAYVGVLLLQTALHRLASEWQVVVCGILLVVMAVGNFVNTVETLILKLRFKAKMKRAKGRQDHGHSGQNRPHQN